MERVIRWCTHDRISGLYFLCRPDNIESIRVAESNHFQLMDIRVTLQACDISKRARAMDTPALSRINIRPGNFKDIPQLQNISKGMYTESRFYSDPRLSKKAPDLYKTWIKRSFEDFADNVLVAASGNVLLGYITCSMKSQSQGDIGLFGIREGARGIGLGALLIANALAYFRLRGARQVRVVTQGRNIGALRLYQKCGFIIETAHLWYHRWHTA
jgi:ribosomal protein S18 acetylase RimI-like enzyme